MVDIKTKDIELPVPVVKSWTDKVADGQKEEKFFEVVVSGVKEDRDGERVSQEAIDDMIRQFKSGTIPLFPDHGRDSNGNRLYSWKQIMGVWVDAHQDGENLKAVARLNSAHPDAELLWNYIHNEKMPVGFSIGGRPLHVIEEEVEVE